MTSQSNTPLTTPKSFEVVDLDAIRANWEQVQAQKPHEVVAKRIEFYKSQGASPDVIQALSLLWTDMNFLFNGGYEKMKEKK